MAIGKKLTGIMKRIEACTTIGQLEELYEEYVKERRLHVTVAEMLEWKERESA